MPDTTGELIDTDGQVLGRHSGYEKFTIGQRKGLGITFGEPRYVVKIDSETRQVTIGQKADLACEELKADRLNWLVDVPRKFKCKAKIRYRHTPCDAEAEITSEDELTVRLSPAQNGVAPGQAVVLYDDDRVLGGGWIK